MKHKVGNEDNKIVPRGLKRNRSVVTGTRVQYMEVNKLIESGGN